jgi:hypothetical protein
LFLFVWKVVWCECESDESVVAMQRREPETREQNRQLSVRDSQEEKRGVEA